MLERGGSELIQPVCNKKNIWRRDEVSGKMHREFRQGRDQPRNVLVLRDTQGC